MKIYRWHLIGDGGNSAGYAFAGSKAEAARMRAEQRRNGLEPDLVPKAMEVPTNKAGLLHWLNAWAAHPDNG